MSNTYKTRSIFEIAENEQLDIRICGLWFRTGSTEYCVMRPNQPSERFSKLADAIVRFEQLTRQT